MKGMGAGVRAFRHEIAASALGGLLAMTVESVGVPTGLLAVGETSARLSGGRRIHYNRGLNLSRTDAPQWL